MISVCIATYNGAGMILEQLNSILPQLSATDEVVIADDGSTDNTVALIRSLNHPLIRFVEGDRLKSPIYNFERALKAAKGDIIFLSDQDDRWMPNKVQVMCRALEQYDCVVSDCHVADGHMNITADSFYAVNHTRFGFLYNLLCRNGYLGCCMAFRRCVLERALPFPKHLPMHDIWIGNVAASFFTVGFIPDKLIMFRRHGHNASVTAGKSTYTLRRKLMFRLSILLPLLKLRFSRRP